MQLLDAIRRVKRTLRAKEPEQPRPSRPQGAVVPGYEVLLEEPTPEFSVPRSMMSRSEQVMLFNLAQHFYEGRGLVIDAGIFLGASTVCLGQGVGRNARSAEIRRTWPQPIVSFDLAIVNKTMGRFFKRHGLPEVPVGNSLVPLIEANIAGVRDLVEFRAGDLMQTGRIEAPIEVLFLDCLKQEALSRFAVANYFPQLVPGAFVIQQDYLSDMLPFIKVHQEFFSDYFDFIGEFNSSAVYRCRAAIPQHQIDALGGVRKDPAAQIRLAQLATTRTQDPARQMLVSLSVFRLIAQLEGLEAGRAYLENLKREQQAMLAEPALSRRVRNALAGADALCASDGSRRAFIATQLVSLGHEPTEII